MDVHLQGGDMWQIWSESINRQRDALTRILRDPLEQITGDCIPLWGQCESIENLFLISFPRIPYCAGLYALNTDGRQISATVSYKGVMEGTFGRNLSQRPYLKNLVPAWGFLLSDAYISQQEQCPTITALQIVRSGNSVLGFIGADFDLRDLPITSEIYLESTKWQQLEHEHSSGNRNKQQTLFRSKMDKTLDQSHSTIEDLMTSRGIFQCGIHFCSGQVALWKINDPYRYQLLDYESLNDSNTLQNYPFQQYPENAEIPRTAIGDILERLRKLRQSEELVYLRSALINLFNGKIRLNFSGDTVYFLHYDEFLEKKTGFWNSSSVDNPRTMPA